MRIIGGEARSRQIDAPKGMDTRPTLDRVRETVFDVIQFQVAGADVLDLFAGSGAYGLEALSRGAQSAVFNDHSPAARRVIEKNIDRLGYREKAETIGLDAHKALDLLGERGLSFGLIFLDPPYRMSMDSVLSKILSLSLLSQNGIVIAEYSDISPAVPGGMTIFKAKKAGMTHIAFIRLGSEEKP